MWIMIAGPFRSGARDDGERQQRLDAMNRAALEVFRLGHTPVIGVNMALPIIKVAGDASYDDIMMPISLALTDRCDACLRIGGPSEGADREVDRFIAARKPVYHDISELVASN